MDDIVKTIERLAEALKREKSPVKRILVVAIPPQRSTMHLDTVFTQISRHECLCYPPMILAGGAEEADVVVGLEAVEVGLEQQLLEM